MLTTDNRATILTGLRLAAMLNGAKTNMNVYSVDPEKNCMRAPVTPILARSCERIPQSHR
jgi:hypothetical protein